MLVDNKMDLMTAFSQFDTNGDGAAELTPFCIHALLPSLAPLPHTGSSSEPRGPDPLTAMSQ